MEKASQKIVPNLWFDQQAEEAVDFYTSIFNNSKILNSSRYSKAGVEVHHQEPGSIMTIEFQLENFTFVALNGGPHFRFNPSISFFVLLKSETEIDNAWERLVEGGDVLLPLDSYEWSPKYGWLQDRFGLNWQLMLNKENAFSQIMVPSFFFTGKNNGNAEEAVRFYTSIFKDSNIEGFLHYGEENQYAVGKVKHAQFQLEGQTFMAMDSGVENDFPFNEAISFIVNCKDQQEIDHYWDKLSEGGDPRAQQCGWLKDKFGVSWQILPTGIGRILNDPDNEKTEKAMQAVLKMKKFDLGVIKEIMEK